MNPTSTLPSTSPSPPLAHLSPSKEQYDTEETVVECSEYFQYFEQCQCSKCQWCSHCTSECQCSWAATDLNGVLARLLAALQVHTLQVRDAKYKALTNTAH
jgi:hypothetical protein